MKRLFDMSVETRQFFIPMHEQPVFKKMGFFKNIKLPVCEALGRKGLYLPSGINLKDNEIKYVADCIRKSAKK
jgi:perosamine synthetase